MRKLTAAVVLGLLICGAPVSSSAQALSREHVPEPLRPWVDWVLHKRESDACPFFLGNLVRRSCSWPSRLELTVAENGGHFSQDWTTLSTVWVPLPGDERRWPQNVTVNGKPAVITPSKGMPGIEVPEGRHTVAGEFLWSTLPEMIAVPAETGLLALTVHGQLVPFPNRDAQGLVWLQKRSTEETGESRVDLTVQRHVADGIPLILTTRLRLRVSGLGREVVLGKALPDRFVPMSIDGALPARIEQDGSLLVQVRPGTWNFTIRARHEGPAAALGRTAAAEPWPAEEVWVFAARPEFRLVTVEGVTAVDPQQTELPGEWNALPAYLMRTGDTMRFDQKRRGDGEPAPDHLTLEREWWLDFDGQGYTVHDAIGGSMNRSWRLEIATPWQLGRIALAGKDQFITRMAKSDAVGIETHHGSVRIDADSRLAGPVGDVPAVGWMQDFHQVTAKLRLPPGWRLLHATGVDDVAPTWVSRWTLLDLFVVLIAVFGTASLWGWPAGVVALAALGLSYIEPGAPRSSWLAVLAAEVLCRVVPTGTFLSLVRIARTTAIIGLALVAVPFMVAQLRVGMYPALEYPWSTVGEVAQDQKKPNVAAAPAPVQEMNEPSEGGAYGESGGGAYGEAVELHAYGEPEAEDDGERAGQGYGSAYQYQRSRMAVDPAAQVQTGPGLPRWGWNTVSLSWRGPVEADQKIRFFYLGPNANLVAALLRVALVALLGVCLSGWRPRARRSAVGRTIASFALVLVAQVPARADAEMPTYQTLQQLAERLLAPPECAPTCASSARMSLEITPTAVRAVVDLDVAAESAVPLPGVAQHWLPTSVRVDGGPDAAPLQSSDGTLWLLVAPGKHAVTIAGPLPDRDTVQIALPLKPHRVETHAQGWQVSGVDKDGIAEDSLQLTRVQTADHAASAALQQETLPPFVGIRRTITFGLTWQVATTVTRSTPPGSAVVLEVPLLSGESVTTPGIRVEDGKALVNMAAPATEVYWESTLAEARQLILRAPQAVSWTETWEVAASSIWHLEADGIAVTHQTDRGQARVRTWNPWPGETVTLNITRPDGVPGQTFTIDRSVLEVSPGLRSSDVSLDVDVRSSRGAQHALTLPPDAELQSVEINGVVQSIRQEERQVVVPLVPGHQSVQVKWRQRGGIATRFTAPLADLGVPSVNADIRIAMPADRWTLLTSGPRVGPAVLFWSVLGVVLLLSFGLARVPLTPLRTHQWFLLGIGLSQSSMLLAMIVVGWLLALGWRREHWDQPRERFNPMQVLLGTWTIIAMFALYKAVAQGLLGLPEMQIRGNGSHAGLLRWYQDRITTMPREAWVLSVPLLVYRLAMLAWALWLAQALLRWLRWGWECFSTGGLWQPVPRKAQAAPPAK